MAAVLVFSVRLLWREAGRSLAYVPAG